MSDGLLNQDEIDALLGNAKDTEAEEKTSLSEIEKDTLGEIGNISMGTSATTLFTLLGQKVTITTPRVEVTDIDELSKHYPLPFVAIEVKYKEGLEGVNLLILKISDVKIIADLMMGGEGKDLDDELTEIDLSAIGEAMNQMVGSSSTSLAEMFNQKIDIDPPQSYKIDFREEKLNVFEPGEKIVKVSFKMIVGDLIDSEIMQLIPLRFAKDMVDELIGESYEDTQKIEVNSDELTENINSDSDHLVTQETKQEMKPNQTQEVEPEPLTHTNSEQLDMSSAKGREADEVVKEKPKEYVNISTPQFQQFDESHTTQHDLDIDIIQDIPVEITVELGKTKKKIGEILEYGPGTIIELDKLLGEPLEIYANNKYIAKGEVVVIEDNFGIRVTEIVSPIKRIKQN